MLLSAFQPYPARVAGRGGVQTVRKRVVQRLRSDARVGGDVGGRDRLVGVGVDEGHRPA
jgi:hypothetical protein